MALRIDHIVWGVDDLDRAAAEVQERYGLASVPGGRHPGWGTANRIVPLGGSYVELITVVDAEEALQSQFGTAVRTKLADGGDHLFAWCVASDDFDAEIARLRLPAAEGSRQRP